MPIEINKFKGDGDLLVLNELGASAVQATFDLDIVTSAGGSTLNGKSWTFATDRNNYYVWYNVEGALAGPSDPAVAGRIGIPVTLSSAAAIDGSAVVSATLAQLSKLSEIGVTQAASVLTVTVRLHASVESIGVASPFAVSSSTLGVPRRVIAVNHVIYTSSAGLVEALIDPSGSVWDIAASTWRVEDTNSGFGGSRLFQGTNLAGNAAEVPVKADNLVIDGTQRGVFGSNIFGVS